VIVLNPGQYIVPQENGSNMPYQIIVPS
jgi:hypothetical protein